MTAPALSHGREVVHPAATHKGAWAILEILATEQTGIRKCINTLQHYAIA